MMIYKLIENDIEIWGCHIKCDNRRIMMDNYLIEVINKDGVLCMSLAYTET